MTVMELKIMPTLENLSAVVPASKNGGDAKAVTTNFLSIKVEPEGRAYEIDDSEVESEDEFNFFTVDDERFIYDRVDFKATWLFKKLNFLLSRQRKAVDKAVNSKGGVVPIRKMYPKVTLYRKKDIVVRPLPILKPNPKPVSVSAPKGGNSNQVELKGKERVSSGQPLRKTLQVNRRKSALPPRGCKYDFHYERISTRSMDRRLRSSSDKANQLKYT